MPQDDFGLNWSRYMEVWLRNKGAMISRYWVIKCGLPSLGSYYAISHPDGKSLKSIFFKRMCKHTIA